MKAAVVHSFDKPLTIEDVPKPKADSGEVVVKIETCGLCHSDIHAAHGDWPFKPNLPLIPGHEAVGIVESVGNGVKEVKEGDRVAIPWMGYACGSRRYCVSGWETRLGQKIGEVRKRTSLVSAVMIQITALRSRLEKQPTDLRRNPMDLGDGALVSK